MKLIAPAFILGLSLFAFFGCKSSEGQPYHKQTEYKWSQNACGAFSSAYFLAETGQISGSQVVKTAKNIYSRIIFDPQAGFGEYSDPFKIVKEMSRYAASSTFKMNLSNPQTGGEKLMSLFAKTMGTNEIEDIKDIESALKKGEYVIEVVSPVEVINLVNPMQNPLHYVLTYWKGDTLYTLDPGRGLEEPRSNFIDGTTTRWSFCNCGIFLSL